MVHSTWGDWFLREQVEARRPDGVAVWYLGCNGFIIRSAETTLYFDPYFADGDPPFTVRMIPVPLDPADATLCDAVFVSHEHIDHMHPPSYGPLVEEGATLHAPAASFTDLDYRGALRAPEGDRRVVAAGDTVDVGDFTVHVRPAHDPDAVEPVSYVVEHDAGTFFHAGDARPAEAFAETGRTYDIDLGALAFGSVGNIRYPEDGETRRTTWYMDENQVVEAANQLELDRLIPVHWDMWRGMDADPKAVHEHATSHRYPRVVEVAKVGDRLSLSAPGVEPPRY
jgi:L-ascorbate 6-phosphate lactonase